MWENPAVDTPVSYHEWRVAAIAKGQIEPDMIGDVNLDERTRSTGVSLTMEKPPQGWQRLRWSTVASRIGVQLDPTQGVLEAQLRPFTTRGSWPVSVVPPPEGTLDIESLALLARLLSQNTQVPTIGYWFIDWMGGDGKLRLGSVEEIAEVAVDRKRSPNNWWPVDRSWLVWSDYDLQTSAVFGADHLINQIAAQTTIETMPYRDVTWPPGSGLHR